MVKTYLYTENDFPSLGICCAQATKYASWGIHPGFEAQGRGHQKSKTGVSLAPQKALIFSKKLKYQAVKKFHMLVRIGVIVKLWFSILSNLKSHIIIHPKRTNDDAPSNFWKLPKCPVKVNYTKWIYITAQNMPQTSNFYYHPLNQCLPGATNGNQGQTMMDL